jgi:hypothetical protein
MNGWVSLLDEMKLDKKKEQKKGSLSLRRGVAPL